MSECPYTALGVAKTASYDEIRRAYRRLTQLHHPDKHTTAAPAIRAANEERFKAISAGWSILCDADNRAKYDRDSNSASLEDIFGDLFRDPPKPAPGATLSDLFGDFLRDLFNPTTKPTHAAWPAGGEQPVSRRGVHLRRPLAIPFLLALRGGSTYLEHGDPLLIKIPAGVRSGVKLRLKGKGEPGIPPGDLFVELEVEAHPHVRREQLPDEKPGDPPPLNLHAELRLTWHELVAGGPLRVLTPWGWYPLRFAPLELSEGHEIEVPGYGVRLADGRRGSLIYTVRLVQPPADAAGLADLRETLAYLQARQHPRADLEGSMS